jgi:hypothetical protein
MFAKIKNNQVAEYPVTEFDIRAKFPNTSFTTDFLSGLPDGYVRVQLNSRPADDDSKVIAEGQPTLIDGLWTQTWTQTDKYTAEELAAQATAATAEKWSNLRMERNDKLSLSDWTQLPDSNVDKNVWATYRQQLRDLPSNTANIDNVVWPTVPGVFGIA